MKKNNVIILGAGPVGLICGWLLSEKKWNVSIYEMKNDVGGMCRSWKWQGHILDTGPHIFHTYDKDLTKFWKKNFGKILQEGKYFSHNILDTNIKNSYPYPISIQSIKKYPNKLKQKIFNELKKKKNYYFSKNFREFIQEQVGPTLTKMFFEGYPKKVWGISTDKMTADWAPKRIKITKNTEPFFQKQFTAVSKYGTGNFYKSISNKIIKNNGKIFLNKAVVGFSKNKNLITKLKLKKKDIQIKKDDIIISTLPITLTSKLLGYDSKLKFRGVRSVYVSVNKKRCLPEKINWIYSHDENIIFNRVSEAGTMTKTVVKKNNTYLTCEISFQKNDKIDKMNFKQVKDKTVKDLILLGLIKKEKDILSVSENKENFVYPVQFVDYKSELSKTKQNVEKYEQIYSMGTGGEFDYADSQILFHKSMDLVKILEKKNNELQEKKQTVITTLNEKVKLGSKIIGDGNKPFIIAEAGLNHNGSFELAKKLIDEAKRIKCDAVKFQTFSADRRVSKLAKSAKYSEKADGLREDIYEMFNRLELNEKDTKKLFLYAKKRGITMFSTPFSIQDLETLERIGVPFYKIASVDCVNLPLIEAVGNTMKPLILSTGMSNLSIVEDAVEKFKNTGNQNLILLHCLSAYPASEKEMNLKAIKTLKKIYNIPVGLSDHYPGIEISILSLGMGANIIERHFTLNKNLEGPDHILSSEPKEMEKLTNFSKSFLDILGDGTKKIQPSEFSTINSQRKCFYALKKIKKGEKLTLKNLIIKGPAGGILPKDFDLINGRKSKRNIAKDEPITWMCI